MTSVFERLHQQPTQASASRIKSPRHDLPKPLKKPKSANASSLDRLCRPTESSMSKKKDGH
jgi:hypothetical protein